MALTPEEILRTCRRWAVVGVSARPERDSHRVATFLRERGYEVFLPVGEDSTQATGDAAQKIQSGTQQLTEDAERLKAVTGKVQKFRMREIQLGDSEQ